jgi:hypothetical protein
MKRVVAGLVVALGLSGGPACNSAKPMADAGVPVAAEAVAPAPARLVAEFALRKPKETWAAVRTGIGGTVSLLADSPAQVIANAAGVDSQLAAELLHDAPIVGVVSVTEAHDPVVLVALQFANPAKAFADAGVKAPLAFLPASPAAAATGLRAAVDKRGYLLIAAGPSATEDEVKRLAPYLLTKVAVDARAPVSLVGAWASRRAEAGLWVTGRDALGPEAKRNLELSITNAKTALEAADKRKRESKGGRAPDFGDAAPLIAKLVESKDDAVKLLDQSAQVTAYVGVRDGEFIADVDVAPTAGGPLAAMLKGSKTCAANALGDEPRQSVAAYFTCEAVGDRRKSVGSQVALIADVIGSRGPEERRALEALAKSWPDARSDAITASVVLAGDDGLPFARVVSALGSVASADAARTTVRELLARPLVADALHVKLGSEKPIGDATYAIALRRRSPPKDVQIVWSTARDQLFIAALPHAGAEQIAAVRAPKTRLSEVSAVSRELKVLGKETLAALVLQPLLAMVSKRQPTAQAAMLSLSRDQASGHAVVRLLVNTDLARELIKLRTE